MLDATGNCRVGLLGGQTKKETAARREKGGINWGFVKKVFSFLLYLYLVFLCRF